MKLKMIIFNKALTKHPKYIIIKLQMKQITLTNTKESKNEWIFWRLNTTNETFP